MKKIIFFLFLFTSASAFSQTVADVVNGMIPQVNGIEGVLSIICYISGVGLGIKGLIKLKEVNESRGQLKLITPVLLLAAAGLLLALPTLLSVGTSFMGLEDGNNTGSQY